MKISFAAIMYNEDWEVTKMGGIAFLKKGEEIFETPVMAQWIEGNEEELIKSMSELIKSNYNRVNHVIDLSKVE